MDYSTVLPAGQILAFWAEAADRLLTQDHGDASLLYLHILRKNNPFPQNWDIARIRQAQGVLLSMGLLPKEFQGDLQLPQHVAKKESIFPPEYTTEDLNMAMGERDSEFPHLVESVEQQLGKSLNTVDLKMLLEIYSHFALPVEVILMVVTTCIRQQELAKTSRKLPSMAAIKSEANRWQNKGIITMDSAMAYTEELSKLSHQQATIIQIFQLKSNSLPKNAQDYITQWNGWGFQLDVYPHAFDLCLNGIGEFKWAYVHGIFKKWHERNLHRLDEVMTSSSQFSNVQRPNYSPQKIPKGPYAHDTLVASANTPPPPELAKRMQADYDAMKKMLNQI